ncbi:hypothetical protein V490_01679, partial [Pseudogymnoascus sp. VKM F-3557]
PPSAPVGGAAAAIDSVSYLASVLLARDLGRATAATKATLCEPHRTARAAPWFETRDSAWHGW